MTVMSIPLAEHMATINKLVAEIKLLIAPIKLPTLKVMALPVDDATDKGDTTTATTTATTIPVSLTGKATDGRLLRDFIRDVRADVEAILSRPDIRAEAYGLSGTKNEILRDRFGDLSTALANLEAAVHVYLEELIDTFAGKDVTQQEINELLRGGGIVSSSSPDGSTGGIIDDVALHKLRVFTHNNPQADYGSFIAREMARLGGHDAERVTWPVDRYGLIQRSILDGFRMPSEKTGGTGSDEGGALKGYKAVASAISSSPKNIIVIYLPNGGKEYFKPIHPAIGDVTKPITVDFIKRMSSISSSSKMVDTEKNAASILHTPLPGKLTSVYVTYDYNTFLFMSPSFDAALTPYPLAIGYYSAMTGEVVDGSSQAADRMTPSPSHATYNDRANAIFADRWYRHDLVILATSFKPGAGLSDALKSHIREGFIRRVKGDDGKSIAAKDIIPSEVIYEAIHRVLPDGSRESRISSYLAADRLVTIFTKEYVFEVARVTWSSHQEVTMMGVLAEVIRKCDKMNVWGIDFKSLKDLF